MQRIADSVMWNDSLQSDEVRLATEHPFLNAAGRRELTREKLSEWLTQDRFYALHGCKACPPRQAMIPADRDRPEIFLIMIREAVLTCFPPRHPTPSPDPKFVGECFGCTPTPL